VPKQAKVKDTSQFKIIGTAKGHWDAPQIVSGKAIYGLDVRLPGMGEMGVSPIAPAVANAVFAATSKWIRHIPIRTEDLKA